MIVECYSADAYCDDPDHAYADVGSMNNPATFTGRNRRETDRQRRRAGWVKINGKDICPECRKRQRELLT